MVFLIKKSLQDFRRSYPLHLTFGLLYMVATSVVFVPFMTFLYHRIIRMYGTASLINSDVMKIALSYEGIFGFLFICFIFVLFLFFQFSVMILIAHQSIQKKPYTIVEAMQTTLRKMPQWFRFGIVPFMFLLLFFTPLLDTPLSGLLTDHVNLPILFTSLASDKQMMLWLYGIFVLAVGYLFLRLIFTLHFMMIDGLAMREAMRQSVRFTKSHKLRIVIALTVVYLLFVVIALIIASMLSSIPNNIANTAVRLVVESYFVPVISLVSLLLSLLLLPLHMTVLTRVYHTYHIPLLDSAQLERSERNVNREKSRLVRSLAQYEQYAFQFFKQRKYTLIFIVFVYLTGMFFVTYAVNDQLVYLKWHVKVIAHRGDWTAPENTVRAVRSAIEKGVDFVEVDVQMTKDGVLVLHHDEHLQRVAGISKRVGDLTFEEISELDIGFRFSETYAGERIPTLEQILQEVDGQVQLLIELKPDAFGRNMTEKIVELIERYEMEQSVFIQSFDYELLQDIRALNPELKIGQVLFFAAGDISKMDVDFYTVRQSMLSEWFIRRAHKLEREVWVWTVNIEKNIQEVLKYDIDGIITDYPEKVQKLIGLHTNWSTDVDEEQERTIHNDD